MWTQWGCERGGKDTVKCRPNQFPRSVWLAQKHWFSLFKLTNKNKKHKEKTTFNYCLIVINFNVPFGSSEIARAPFSDMSHSSFSCSKYVFFFFISQKLRFESNISSNYRTAVKNCHFFCSFLCFFPHPRGKRKKKKV